MKLCTLALFLLASTILIVPSIVQAEEPFDGKSFTGWKFHGDEKKSKWKIGMAKLDDKNPTKLLLLAGSGEMVNTGTGGVDIYTEKKYTNVHVEVEVMIPKGSNSGVYLMGEYEVQVLDSYGKQKINEGDMGGIYKTAVPKKNASKQPGEWQKFVIDFTAPKFENGKKTANGKFDKVVLNDILIHENVEVTKSTGGGLTGHEVAEGPLMFQGDHGAVAYRNLKIEVKK